MTKLCKGCSIIKNIEMFSKDKSKKDRLRTLCKKCSSKRDRDTYSKNKDKIKKRAKKRNQDHKEELKKLYSENKDFFNLQSKKYYQKNKGKVKERVKKYFKTQDGLEVARRSNAKRRALKISTEDGSITKQSLEDLRELQDNKCYYCECKLNFQGKNKVHLDHHIPLSRGGAHTIGNVKYTCNICNLTKHNAMPKSLLLIF